MDLTIFAKHLINSELSKRNINKSELTQKLKEAGFDVTTRTAITNRINNGNFSLVFFLQCMKALGVKNISLEDLYRE